MEGTPRYLTSSGERVYFRAETQLGWLSADGDTVARRAASDIDAVALDPSSRYLLTTTGPGTVVIHDPVGLEPIFGWAAVGAESPDLAFAAEGDVVYQPVYAFEFRETPEILVRDLETGRIRQRLPLTAPVDAIAASARGTVVAAGTTAEGAEASGFAWREGHLREVWRAGLDGAAAGERLRMKIDPAGRLMAVMTHNDEAGLHLVEVETGRVVDRLRGSFRDFAFDREGRLWALYPGELRRLE